MFSFKPAFFVVVVLTFILFTIIGTLTHELGHIAVAKGLGYETELFYGSMRANPKGYLEDPDVIAFKGFIEENQETVQKNTLKENEKFLAEFLEPIEKKYPEKSESSFWITLGGPAQTLLTCFIGLCILASRGSNKKISFSLLDWLGGFFALFVLREVFNTLHAFIAELIWKDTNHHGDEFNLSLYLGFSEWVLPILTALLGLVISIYVVFKVIPYRYRFTFILAGLIGGLGGFALWFGFLGPIVLPVE